MRRLQAQEAKTVHSVVGTPSLGLQTRRREFIGEWHHLPPLSRSPMGMHLDTRQQESIQIEKRAQSAGATSFPELLERLEAEPSSSLSAPFTYLTPRSCVMMINQAFEKYPDKWHIWLQKPSTIHFEGIANLLCSEQYAIFEVQEFISVYNSCHRGVRCPPKSRPKIP